MKKLMLASRLDVAEPLRTRGFLLFALVFGGTVALLMVTGVTESRAMGFTGLSRMLVTCLRLAVVRSAEVAQAAAFALWLALLVVIDLILLGVLLRNQALPDLVIAVSLLNPLQVFRTASMMLFDPAAATVGFWRFRMGDLV